MAATSLPPVRGPRVELRRTSEDDLPYVLRTEAIDENRAFVESWSADEHRAAIADAGSLHLVAVPRDGSGDGPLAYVILQEVDNPARSVFLRRIVVSRKGVGIGRETCQLVLQLCFQGLGAHRVWLNVQEDNAAAIALYESLGFVREGTTRESAFHDGRYSSMYLYGILEDEFHDPSGSSADQEGGSRR